MVVSCLSRISIHHPSSRSARDSQWNRYVTGRPRTHYVDLDVRLTYNKRRYARSPPISIPLSSLPLLPTISTYYGNTTFCDAGQLSPNHPHSRPFHHTTNHHTDFGPAAGAQVRVFFYHPLPFIHSFIHRKEHTLTGFAASNRENPEPFDKPKEKCETHHVMWHVIKIYSAHE